MRKLLLLPLSIFFLFSFLAAQSQVNDACTGALLPVACGPTLAGTTVGATVEAVDNLVYPLHRYRYGRNTSREGYFLKTYRIEESGNGIFYHDKKC